MPSDGTPTRARQGVRHVAGRARRSDRAGAQKSPNRRSARRRRRTTSGSHRNVPPSYPSDFAGLATEVAFLAILEHVDDAVAADTTACSWCGTPSGARVRVLRAVVALFVDLDDAVAAHGVRDAIAEVEETRRLARQRAARVPDDSHVKPPRSAPSQASPVSRSAVAAFGRRGAEVEPATDVEDAGDDPPRGRGLGMLGGARDEVARRCTP